MFPESLNVRETKSSETLGLEGKQNYFPRKQTLSVLLYSGERNISNINTTTQTWKTPAFKVACFAAILFVLCHRAGNNFSLIALGIHCIYLKPRDLESANHI